MQSKHKRLRIRMIEMEVTQFELARQAGLSAAAMSARMNGKKPFHADEMETIWQMLHIPPEEYYLYFFDFVSISSDGIAQQKHRPSLTRDGR